MLLITITISYIQVMIINNKKLISQNCTFLSSLFPFLVLLFFIWLHYHCSHLAHLRLILSLLTWSLVSWTEVRALMQSNVHKLALVVPIGHVILLLYLRKADSKLVIKTTSHYKLRQYGGVVVGTITPQQKGPELDWMLAGQGEHADYCTHRKASSHTPKACS